MGGCFGPKRSKTLVYIDLLQQIYDEAAKIEIPPNGVEAYDTIRDKLTKKGLLKKLVQHLSSHRNFLNECIQNNYRSMKDSNTFKAHIVSLLVSNTLVNNIQQFQVRNLVPRITAPKPTNFSSPHHPEIPNQNEFLGSAIDFRFQNVYFQQAIDLYDLEPTLRQRVLDGMSSFALKKQGNFICDPLVVNVQKKLLYQIKTNNNRSKCCITFSHILTKQNENVQNGQIAEDVLRTFLHVWLDQNCENVRSACERVLQTYISRCLTSREYWFIYTVLFQIFDMHNFREEVMIPLEAKVLEVLSNEDLRNQFLRGMLKHLLTYLSVSSDVDILSTRWQLGVFQTHYQTLRHRYQKILNHDNKINGFIALRRWIQNGYLNLFQLIVFNKSSLISCFILNILCYHRDFPLLNVLITVFLRICKISDMHCNIVIFMMLLQEIYRIVPKTIQPGSIMIRLACVCLENYRLMDYINPQDYEAIFRGVEVTLPHRTRLQLLYLYGVMISMSSTPFSSQQLQVIIKMLHSIFDNFAIRGETLLQKYMLVTSVYAVMKKLYMQGEEQVVMVFTKRLQIFSDDSHYSKQQRYFEKYLAYELLEMIERRHHVNSTMKLINNQILMRNEQRAFYDIQKYMKDNSILSTSRSSQHIFERRTLEKRYDYVNRQFDRYSLGKQYPNVIQPQFLILKQKNSVMGSENLKEDDDSLQNIVGLLREGGQTDYMNARAFAKSRMRSSQAQFLRK